MYYTQAPTGLTRSLSRRMVVKEWWWVGGEEAGVLCLGKGERWKNEAGKQVKRSAAGMVVNTRRYAARQGGTKRWPCAKGGVESAKEVWYDKRHTRETRDITQPGGASKKGHLSKSLEGEARVTQLARFFREVRVSTKMLK